MKNILTCCLFLCPVVATAAVHADGKVAAVNTPSVLLITDDGLVNAWHNFCQWKTRQGLPTIVVTVQTIKDRYDGVDIQAKIRACCLDHIEKHHTRFVVLGGDSTAAGGLVPDRDTHHVAYGFTDVPTDLYYISPGDKDWDANDDGVFGEWPVDRPAIAYSHDSGVSIGRIPVRTAADVAVYTDKVISYESAYPENTFASTLLYTNTVNASEPKVRRSWDDYIGPAWKTGKRQLFLHTETSWDGDTVGSYQLNADHWCERINAQEAGKIHMHGHGFLPAWILEDDNGKFPVTAKTIARLTNEKSYPVMTTVSCFTGEFDGKDPCITESMLRQPRAGAVAILAPARPGVPVFHNPHEDFPRMVKEGLLDGTTEFYTRFWVNLLSVTNNDVFQTIGQAYMSATKEIYKEHLHRDTAAGYHWALCELNLLGDPTLDGRSLQPTTPVLTGLPTTLMPGKQTVNLTVSTALPPGARLVLWQPGHSYQIINAAHTTTITSTIDIGDARLLHITLAGPGLNSIAHDVAIAK